jgi:hypothetical protein
MTRRRAWLVAALAAALVMAAPVHAMFRPGQEHRSVSAARYRLAVQNNGRVDVLLRNDDAVFDDAYPMVWLDGEDAPEPLPLAGRLSGRAPVADAVGHGQGIVLRKKTCEWSLRVYPDQPFFAVQTAYVNTGDEPVRVRALLPWCAGDPRKGGLSVRGNATTPNAGAAGATLPTPDAVTEEAVWGIPWTGLADGGDAVLAGFLAAPGRDAWTGMDAAPDPETGQRWFRAVDRFDPPRVVPPGGRLVSAVLYVSVADHSLEEAASRFIRVRDRLVDSGSAAD